MIKDLSNNIFLGNSLLHWAVSASILLAAILATLVAKKLILHRLKIWAAKTASTLDDIFISIFETSVIPIGFIVAVYFSLKPLRLFSTLERILHVVILFLLAFYTLRVVTALIKVFVFSSIRRQENSEVKEKQAKGLLIIINIIIWCIGIVFIIDNLGYDVTTLVAGLGIGGIAFALAAQTILGDLFSYFVIFFDRPFEIGDFIITEDKMGTVEYVGIKTTRIRTLSGEQLICSNTYLTNAQLHNYKRMNERRVVFKIGVIYQTSKTKLKEIPVLVADIIRSTKEVRLDRAHFTGFGDFSLNFEFVYYVLNPDYNVYMDKHQDICLKIASVFENEHIEFAFPTQSIFVNSDQAPIQN